MVNNMPKKILTILCISTILLALSLVFPLFFRQSEPRIIQGLKIGDYDLSNLTLNEAYLVLSEVESKKVNFLYGPETWSVNLADLGIGLDALVLKNFTFSCIFQFYCQRYASVALDEVSKIQQFDEKKFNDFVEKIDASLNPTTTDTKVSYITYSFYAPDPKGKK